jgi:hypothetical protein
LLSSSRAETSCTWPCVCRGRRGRGCLQLPGLPHRHCAVARPLPLEPSPAVSSPDILSLSRRPFPAPQPSWATDFPPLQFPHHSSCSVRDEREGSGQHPFLPRISHSPASVPSFSPTGRWGRIYAWTGGGGDSFRGGLGRGRGRRCHFTPPSLPSCRGPGAMIASQRGGRDRPGPCRPTLRRPASSGVTRGGSLPGSRMKSSLT